MDWRVKHGDVFGNTIDIKLLKCINSSNLRDLEEMIFILNNYIVDSGLMTCLTEYISNKGLDYFDYLINTQDDELIDKNKLANDFLDLYNRLCLI